jgi:hypothetical protein
VSKEQFDGHVVVTVFDSAGRQVACDFRSEDLYAAFDLVKGFKKGDVKTPSGACWSCALNQSCETLMAFLEHRAIPKNPDADQTAMAFRLFSERVDIMLRLEFLETRLESIDADLCKLIKDGKLKITQDDELVIPTRTVSSWDFAAVRRSLMSYGLWDDSFGSIRANDLQKALDKFPKEVQAVVLKAKSERTTQPSISEAARHGRFATGPAFLGGVTLQGKSTLGKS